MIGGDSQGAYFSKKQSDVQGKMGGLLGHLYLYLADVFATHIDSFNVICGKNQFAYIFQFPDHPIIVVEAIVGLSNKTFSKDVRRVQSTAIDCHHLFYFGNQKQLSYRRKES